MVAQTMVELLKSYGVTPSRSRPSVSNDNAFAESAFSTAKNNYEFPEFFKDLVAAREWGQSFIKWAREHLHSGIGYLAPVDRREGRGEAILANRTEVFEQAKAAHPERWNGRPVRDWSAPEAVYLNQSKEQREQERLRKMARNKARHQRPASQKAKEGSND